MPNNPYLALKAQITDEIAALDLNVTVLNDLLAQANTIPDIALTPALASYIADFYPGCERISERVVVALEGALSQGANWHEQLLQQVSKSGSSDRAPLWSGELISELEPYRKFRHLIRHRYSAQLDAGRVVELAQRVPIVLQTIQLEIAAFNQWLDRQARRQE